MNSHNAIVWLSYFDDPEAEAAFDKLSSEASKWGGVIKVRHDPQESRERGPSEISVSDADIAAALPTRFDQMRRLGRAVNRGFPDLLQFAVVQKLPDFDFYWFLEYDVDFTGSWSTFFSAFADNPADLLGTTLYPRSLSEGWFHWNWFKSPADVDTRNVVRGFFPINRISRRFIQSYSQQAEKWEGHREALFPSIALYSGLAVEDIGGDGPMTPHHCRGRFYFNTSDPQLGEGTFRFYPRVDSHYFPNRVDALPSDHLWHPIKTEAHVAGRHKYPVANASS
jgi:hypothetical protein